MFKKSLYTAIAVLMLFGVLSNSFPSSEAATLLTDDFTGTTINTEKWVEYENQGVGNGGSSGNVQQNGSLTVVGNNAWNSNGIKSVSTFDRSQGDINIEADWTLSNCAATTGGIAYGTWVNGTLQNNTILLNRLSNAFKLWSFNTSVDATGVTCTNGVPIHVRMVIKQAGGVDVYLNNNVTPNGSLTAGQAPNSFNNQTVQIMQYDTSTITLDNLVITQGVDAVEPDAPTDLSATPGAGEVALTWSAPADNGGSAITDYLVEYKLTSEPTTWTTFNDGTSATAATTVTGLTNGLSYDFRISATNAVGTGDPSEPESATPALSVPSAPLSLTAGTGVDGQASLTWSSPLTNGGSVITDYIVQYKLNSEPTTWTTFNDGTSTTLAATVTGLTNGVSYNFRVAAANSVGTGANSSAVTATPSNYALADNFSGTTIDTDKWIEVDAAGAGGTSGLIQQNNKLTATGDNTWGGARLVSQDQFDREDSPVITTEFSFSNTGTFAAPMVYGSNSTLDAGTSSNYFILNHSTGYFFIAYGLNGGAWESLQSTGVAVTANRRYRSIMTVNSTQGVTFQLYQDSNGDNDFNDAGEDTDLLSGGVNTINMGTFSTGHFLTASYSSTTTTSLYSVTVDISDPMAPDAPTGLTASPSSGQVVLSWTAPGSNGGSAITDYLVEYKLTSEPTTWTTFNDGTSTTASATVTGLTNDLSYDFRVSAVNSIGTGSASETESATPALSAPSAPQSLTADTGTSGQIDLGWSAPLSNGGAVISDYIVQYKLSSEPTTWTTFNDGNSTSTSAFVSGLVDGQSYNFKVAAVNSVGTGVFSSSITATPNSYALSDDFTGTTIDTDKWNETDSAVNGTGGSAGNVQQNNGLIVTGNNNWGTNGVESDDTFDRTDGDIEITVVMQASHCTSGNSFEFGYGDMDIVNAGTSYIVTKNASSWQLYSWNNGSSAGVVNLTGISCTPDTDLTMKLVVLEGGGAEVYFNGSETPAGTQAWGTFTNAPVWLQNYSTGVTTTFQSITVTEPSAGPGVPSITDADAGDGEVELTWSVPSNNGSPITDYLVEYKLASDSSWATFNDGTSDENTTTVTGLTNGASYNFRVSAININGSSSASAVATAMPLSATPQAPSAVSVNITGTPTVGELLTGSYTFADPNGDTEGNTSFRWFRADTVGGSYSAISGATNQNYTVTSDDLNKYLKFEVTPVANNSPAIGTPVLSSATAQVDEVDYLNHILSTGQSLSTGTNGAPALSTTQPYSNLMLSGTSLVNLVESGVETMSSSLANTLTALSPGGNYQSVVTRHGVGGTAYSGLKKGTGPYSTGMTQVTNVKNAATGLGRVARVVGVTTIHGESDHLAGNSASYESYLVQWQSDYETDVKAITGQSGDIPLFTDQMSSHTGYNAATSGIPIAQLSASENHPDEIILVGPKYFLNYSDAAHLNAASYRWLGEYYGKVMKKVLVDHEDWRPLSPDSIVRTGNVILANFHVPEGELAFDTTIVSAKANYGFEYYDSTSSATISSVEILDSDTVKVTLSGTPTGSNQRLRYAYTGTPGSQPGASVAGSARGNLRDTDNTPSLHGNTLYNWAVHFDKAITLDSSAPTITSVTSDKADGTYSVGEVIDIDVTFSKAVTSTGNVTVTLETGTTDRSCTFTITSNTTGTCNYTVQSGDATSDLTVNSISGTIADLDAHALTNFVPATNLAANKALVIDTTGPVISGISVTPATTSAVITWTTNKLASTGLTYGLTSTHTATAPVTDTSPRVLSHSKTISSLIACTTYHYSVVSVDASSVSTSSPSTTFTTNGCVGSPEILGEETTPIDASTGGTAQLVNGGNTILLSIPAGATVDNLFYQIKLVDAADSLIGTGIPTGKTPSNLMFDLKNIYDVNTGVAPGFDEPIQITVTYDEDDLNGIEESSLEIWHYSGGTWSSLSPCTVDTNANTVTCSTESFSVFGLFGTVQATGKFGTKLVQEQAHPRGTNIMDSTGTIYTLTADGQRRPYTSAGAYLSYGFNSWSNVVSASQADLTIPAGAFIPPRDGSIVCSDRGADKGTCYLITGGKKAGFTSATVFKALGFSFGNAIYGDVSFMESAPNVSASEQAHLTGTLINNSGTLQIISSGALVGIPSMQVLTSWGYNPTHAVIANVYDKAYSQMMVLAERLAGVLNF